MMRIKPRQLIALCIALGLIAFQLTMKPGRHAVAPRSQAQTGQDSFTLGQLTFNACDIGNPSQATLSAYCTEFVVPENHSDAHSRRIKLKVAIVKSDAAQPDADLITFLDGGPGGAATEDFPAIANAFATLLRHHHVLLIDQRGTGGSNALDCPQLIGDSKNKTPAELEALSADRSQVQTLVRQCLMEVSNKADPQYYATTDAILDLEAVRVALGSPRLNVVGVSYGTRVAQQYATRYPNAVRSIVLDSAVPNTAVLGQDHAQNLEAALKAQFAACTAQAECKQRFGDPYAQLQALRAKVQATPPTVQVPDPRSFVPSERHLTAARLAGLVRLYAYNSATSALLPLMIDEAMRGNYAPLLGQEQLISDDVNSRMTGGMGLSVICSEDVDLLKANDADRDTLLGNSLIDFYQLACAVWPHRARPADFHQAFNSKLPTLVLSGELDPVTPPSYAAEVAKSLSNARVLLAKGQGHAVLGVRCMPQLLSDFIEQLQPKTLDATCLEQLKPVPSFLNYNGAAP